MVINFKDETESYSLRIYDSIGDDGWGNGVTVEDIEQQISDANNKPMNIYINSNGGEVFEGFAIYNILKRYAGYKTVYIDGLAASIASVIALCGNKLVMHKASMMMIHNASGCCIGNAEDMKKVVTALEQINEVIRDVYKTKTNLTDEKLAELMDNETFLTAQECLDFGFADEIIDDEKEDSYTNTLKSLDNYKNELDKRIKMFNDIKKLDLNAGVQVGGNESVGEETNALNNKKSHWAWLNEKGE